MFYECVYIYTQESDINTEKLYPQQLQRQYHGNYFKIFDVPSNKQPDNALILGTKLQRLCLVED